MKTTMRTTSWQEWRAFTMIELLVVIAIIAILAGLLLPAVIGGLKRAEITQAQTEVKLLEQALTAYHADYQKFPGQYVGRGNGPYMDYYLVVATLRGTNTPGTVQDTLGLAGANNWNNQNPRQRVYLEVSEKSICTNGSLNAGAAIVAGKGDLMDPWGNRYVVAVDFTDGNQLAADGETLRRNVAVWSWGPDPKAVAPSVGVMDSYCSPTNTSHIRSWRN